MLYIRYAAKYHISKCLCDTLAFNDNQGTLPFLCNIIKGTLHVQSMVLHDINGDHTPIVQTDVSMCPFCVLEELTAQDEHARGMTRKS